MYLHIVPIDQQLRNGQIYRGPMYLRWRFGTGYDWQWALKDFRNDIPVALVATSKRLPVRDEDLRSYGIETKWIERAASPRERMHRTLGMAFAMQAGIDRPDLWLGRDIHFGHVGMLPAVDQQMYALEQEILKQQIIEPLRIQWERKHPRFNWRAVLKQMALMPLAVLMAALPATDVFTSASDQGLTTYSPNWIYNGSSIFTVRGATDDVVPATGTNSDSLAHWNDVFNNDQYSQVSVSSTGSNDSGAAARVAASAMTGYAFSGNNAASYLSKYLSAVYTQLGSNGESVTAGDAAKISTSGNVITPNKNGSTTGTPGAQTDASISSGSAGMYGYSNTSQTALDNWEGGNLAGASATSLLLDRGRRSQDLLVR